MSAQNDGGPAFPSHGSMGDVVCEGMTLRDYFAAKALSSYVGSSFGSTAEDDEMFSLELVNAASLAYRLADAMMAARSGT